MYIYIYIYFEMNCKMKRVQTHTMTMVYSFTASRKRSAVSPLRPRMQTQSEQLAAAWHERFSHHLATTPLHPALPTTPSSRKDQSTCDFTGFKTIDVRASLPSTGKKAVSTKQITSPSITMTPTISRSTPPTICTLQSKSCQQKLFRMP